MKSKINFTLFKKLINIKVLIGLIIIFVSVFSYRSEFIMFKGLDKLTGITEGKLGIKAARVGLMKSVEELSFPNYMSEYYKVPLIDISLSQKDINSISKPINNVLNYEDIYYKSPFMLPIHGNNYSNAAKIDITFEDESYEGKIKIHGRSDEHFLNLKKSFAIKFDNQKLPNSMREIALIILDEQDVTTIFSYFMVEKYLGIKVNSKIVRLRINGIDQGLYLLEEKERKELLEKNKLSGVDVLQPNAMWTTQTPTTHTHQFTHNISSVNFKNYSEMENGQLFKYKKLYASKDYETISKLVDIDQFARFEALRMTHADLHSAKGDNLKLLYNNSTGKFSPFFRSESVIGDLEAYVSENIYLYDSIAFDIPILEILTQNNNFRNLRNKYLYEIIQDRAELKEYYASVLEKFVNAVSEDTSNLLSQRDYIYQAESKFKLFEKNLNAIEKYLAYGRMYSLLTSYNPREYVLEIDADSNVFTKLTKIQIFGNEYDDVIVNVKNLKNNKVMKVSEIEEYFKNERFILGLNKNLQTEDNTKIYHLSFDQDVDVNNFEISFLNEVTGKEILDINNYVKYIKQTQNFSFDFLSLSLEEFLSSNENFFFSNNAIHFKKTEHIITGNLIFPYGYDVKIPGGTIIKMNSESNILIYGGLKVDGTNSNPVIVQNNENRKPFGSILVLGDKNSIVEVKGLDLSGGSDSYLNGVFASGAFSIHNHNTVKISDSYIHHNSADDGINIKNANIELYGNVFASNFADQIDIDFAEGIIENNIFLLHEDIDIFGKKSQENTLINIVPSDNGDGIDFSGSKVKLKNNLFKGFIDKAVSIGEETFALLDSNSFQSNRSAVTAKDQSSVYLVSNTFENNDLNIEMYQKKIFFELPNVYLLNENHEMNKIQNSDSNIYEVNQRIDNIRFSDNIDLLFQELKLLEWSPYLLGN